MTQIDEIERMLRRMLRRRGGGGLCHHLPRSVHAHLLPTDRGVETEAKRAQHHHSPVCSRLAAHSAQLDPAALLPDGVEMKTMEHDWLAEGRLREAAL